jgi:predicted ester cyclase
MTDFRVTTLHRLRALASTAYADLPAALAEHCHPAVRWRVAHPVGEIHGTADIADAWYRPLRHAFPRLSRRDEIVIGGTSTTGSGQWVATLGHIVGAFETPFLGVSASSKLAFLRVGEFYRIEEGRIAEAVILPDLLDLMRQSGHFPLPHQLGTEMLFPGPATHDGVLPQRPDLSAGSVGTVEAMLADLKAYDPATFESHGQFGPEGYWREDMLWYGPGGIGANTGYLGFQRDHRIPFLTAFPDRVGGNHFARFGDGPYVASGGWPSMTMTFQGAYLGMHPTGAAMTLRVMDFWRVAEDGQIAENWVLLDMLDLFMQMGRDLIAEAQTL